jgi:hypothetical protein
MIEGHVQFRRFRERGFEGLVGSQPAEVVQYLESLATETGAAAPLFLSQAVRAVDDFMHAHDEAGGVRLDFLKYIDSLLFNYFDRIQSAKPEFAAAIARNFHDEVKALLTEYDPSKPHGL